MDILSEIVEEKRRSLAAAQKKLPLYILKKRKPPVRDFRMACGKKPFSIIGEVKKASPSQGLIVRKFFPGRLAKIYEKAGISAISTLTEEKFFKGCLENIIKVKKNCSLPVLRKDFIFTEYQIYESRYFASDALLLIVRILEKKLFENLFSLTLKLGMTPLVEIYDEEDLKKIKGMKIPVLGINTRNLRTGKIDFAKAARLARMVKSEILICESGVREKSDIEKMQKYGFNSFLIGTSILKKNDKIAFIKSLNS